MKTEVWIGFDGRDIPGGVEALLAATGCGSHETVIEYIEVLRRLDVDVTLPDGDERVQRLVEQLERHGQRYGLAHHDRYTEEELESARLLLVQPNRECEVDGGSEFGTTYDLSGACPACGAGARQNSALFLDGDDDQLPKLKGHRAGHTYRTEFFVDERLATALEELGPTGLAFHSVYALMPDKRQVKLPWKQLSADRTLPRMSPQTTGYGLDDQCGLCERSGYRPGTPLRIVYRASDLEGAGDVNLTWEEKYDGCIKDDPRESWLPVPQLLVTPKVMRVFRSAGVTAFDWLPIRVDDS
jgi:hypothetical protein